LSEAIIALKSAGGAYVRHNRASHGDDRDSNHLQKMPYKAIIQRTEKPVHYRLHVEMNFTNVAAAKGSHRAKENSRYPRALVLAFGFGIAIFMIGFVGLVARPLIKDQGLHIAAAGVLALGAIIVALSLLRGQDIDERTG
jgi:hypothetical protein